jgi:ATP adenylyltransferase
MGYIGGEPQPGCLFCRVIGEVDGDEANHVLYRGEHSLVMLNLYPYNSGHVMVVPYQHTGDIANLEPAIGDALFRTAQLTTRALGSALHPDGLNLGINQGAVAGAGIADHVHLHVVPRWNGDTNFMPVLADTKVIVQSLESLYDLLADALRPETS